MVTAAAAALVKIISMINLIHIFPFPLHPSPDSLFICRDNYFDCNHDFTSPVSESATSFLSFVEGGVDIWYIIHEFIKMQSKRK